MGCGQAVTNDIPCSTCDTFDLRAESASPISLPSQLQPGGLSNDPLPQSRLRAPLDATWDDSRLTQSWGHRPQSPPAPL